MCSALAAPPWLEMGSLTGPIYLGAAVGRSAARGGAGEDVVHRPHRQLVGRRELALDPVAELDVARGEDQVAVLLDPLEDLLGDVLGGDGALLEARFQLGDA